MRAALSFVLTAIFMVPAFAADSDLRVLFLSKSSGFQHSAITAQDDGSNHVAKTLKKIAGKQGFDLVTTKDASMINAATLKDFDVVIFYTTGDLTQPGTDGTPPMGPNGVADLHAWVEAGGGFIGYHCASDTFHMPDGSASPYIQMLGAEFLTHGRQFPGKVKVVDKKHPAMKGFTNDWVIRDEWYMFKNMNKDGIHVMALLDPGRQRERQAEKYNVADYPVVWCSAPGDGRVYYNAMGHREDVWDNPDFQTTVWSAIQWASGEGKTKANPNYASKVKE